MKHILALLLTIGIGNATAQAPPCYTDQLWAQMVNRDSSLLIKKNMQDAMLAQYNKQAAARRISGSRSSGANPLIIIPTVVYIVNDSTPESNISMQQIQSQMDQLNQTYANYGFEFCYAQKDVTTNLVFTPQTGDSVGVFRITSPLTNLDLSTQDPQLKALSTLSPDNYMRIFVVKSIAPTGVLGYAYFPGTAGSEDGVVVRSDVFGSNNYCSTCSFYPDYNLGATLVHEVGHYLNLYHTFQGGCDYVNDSTYYSGYTCEASGDDVCDTPPTATENFGCPSPAPLSCDGINTVLIQDYMDYTDDACKNLFTPGQTTRMQQSAQGLRNVLISTQNLINTGITCVSFNGLYSSIGCDNFNGCQNDTMVFYSLNSSGFTYHWNYGDGDSSVGTTGIHVYRDTGRFQVTLTATNQAQHINETGNELVIVTPCAPIYCPYNKWEFTQGYLDFSSGSPKAINHPIAMDYYTDYFASAYRGDSLNNPLFHLECPTSFGLLLDSGFNVVDTLADDGKVYAIVPCPSGGNKYCLIVRDIFTFKYTIVTAENGHVTVDPKVNQVPITLPDQATTVRAIPNCDGTAFWIIIGTTTTDKWVVCELNEQDTITVGQTYSIPSLPGSSWPFEVSPDGRKIIIAYFSGIQAGFYLLNFDKSKGVITADTDYVETFGNLGSIAYWGSFSPNSRYYYAQGPCCQTGSNIGYIYQYDLYNPDPMGTRKAITPSTATLNYSNGYVILNIGPDKKVYMGYATTAWDRSHQYQLSVICYPDVAEDGANSVGFLEGGPYLVPPDSNYYWNSTIGFSGFEDYVHPFGCDWKPGVPSPISYFATACQTYQFHSDDCWDHLWNFGDTGSGLNDTSTGSDPVHNFSGTGTYIVTESENGYTMTDTIQIGVQTPQIVSSPLQPCPEVHANYSVAVTEPNITYNWRVTNGQPAYLAFANNVDVYWDSGYSAGQVTLIAIDNTSGCVDSVTIPVVIAAIDSNAVSLVPEGNINTCAGEDVQLQAVSASASSFIWYLNDSVITGVSSSGYTARETGNYYVSQEDSSGCFERSPGTTINFVNLPAGAITASTEACTKQTVGYSVNPLSNVIYNWSATGGNIVTGQGTDSVGITWIITGTGYVTVHELLPLTPDTCLADTTLTVTVSICSGIQEAGLDNIGVYPNPATDNLEIKGNGLSGTLEVQLFNSISQRIISHTEEINGQFEILLDVKALPAGIYLLWLKTDEGNLVKKIVKE